jgi:hypothetical protein
MAVLRAPDQQTIERWNATREKNAPAAEWLPKP